MTTISQESAGLIVLMAVILYVNNQVLKLHPTIGLLLGGLVVSAISLTGQALGLPIGHELINTMIQFKFDRFILDFLLGFLLFAGAIHVSKSDLLKEKGTITIFALVGVLITAFVVGGVLWMVCMWLGVHLAFTECLLFGALISPTDPIAVLAIMQKVGAPKQITTIVCGESLFNDGVGVVLFMTVLAAHQGQNVTALAVGGNFILMAGGGLVIGILYGWLVRRLLRTSQTSELAVLITLALAGGGYTLANNLHCSGAIAMVVAGVMVGERLSSLSPEVGLHLGVFWTIIDEIGNSLVFLLVGLELVAVKVAAPLWNLNGIILGISCVAVVLLGRFLSVAAPMVAMRPWDRLHRGSLSILVWGGLRGALPLAMALSVPHEIRIRGAIIVATYAVVAFSIIVQGLTIPGVIRRVTATGPSPND